MALKRGEIQPGEKWPKELPPTPTVLTLAEYAEVVFANIGPRLKPRTLEFYQECMKRIGRFAPLAGAKLDTITKRTLDAYVSIRLAAEKGNTPHASNGELRCLRRILRYAVETDVLDKCPSIHCLPAEGRDRVITRVEEEAYLKVARGDIRDAFLILLDVGLRPDSELYGLRWENVRVNGIAVASGKTKKATRLVPLSQRVQAVLEMRRTRTAGSEFVFPSPESVTGHAVTFNKRHYAACKAAKLEIFPLYSLRHTFGTRCAQAGMNRHALAYLMGHSSPSITDRYYIHVQDRDVRSPSRVSRPTNSRRACPSPRMTAPRPTIRLMSRSLPRWSTELFFRATDF
ncbi:MAG TPA: tyrosine-type recombinase/integrase [Terriglobia bacterium]|nr:tyrosine-type recombinase/integrase [Terriglobia bacterium]